MAEAGTTPTQQHRRAARGSGKIPNARDEALRRVNSELSRRLAALQTDNAEIRDARRAALNLMEDAVQSRQAVESLNEKLRENEKILRQNEVWLAAQKEAFQAAMNGAALETSLGVLVRAATENSDSERRCAFYIAQGDSTLRHLVGMPESYARHVDGFEISSESLACGLAVAEGEPVITPDVEKEPRWAPWLWLAREFDYRGCWSFPVETASGKLVGTFAMYFREPHEPTPADRELCQAFSQTAAIIISRHWESQERARAEVALRDNEERFRTMSDNVAQLAWMCDRLGDVTWYNQRWLDYTGLTFEEMKDWGWKQVQHPDHVDRVVVGVKHSRETGEIWEDTFPLRGKDGTYRWFLSRAVPIRDAIGNVVRWFGTNTDVTALRDAEGRQELLVNELNHRVKNMLATVQSIAAQTFRAAKLDSSVRENFEARLVALSNAHSILTEESWAGAEIHDILARTLEPHAGPERLLMQGPPIRLSPKAALAISMAMHELATNAVKYGAWSNGTGRIAVNWTVGGSNPGILTLQWTETGGPVVSAPAHKGFGSRLIERNLSHDLDGEARIDYRPEGVVCTVVSPLESAWGGT